MLRSRFVLYLGATCLGLNLAALACAEEKEPKWDPLVSDKAAIGAPPEVLKRAFPEGIGGGYLAVNPRNGDLYVEGHACLKSTDGGKTYALVAEGFSYCGGYPLCTDIHTDGKKIAVFGWCDLPGSSGSGYSLDGGKTWEPFASFDDKTQKARGGMTGGALEPGNGKTVLARGYNYQVKNLFYSADLGKTWTKLAKTRDGVMGWGVFGPRDLVMSYGNRIERSEDAGATWNEVAKFGKCAGPVLHLGGAAYWLSDKGLIVSKDGGKTWAIQGVTPPSPIRTEIWTGLLPGKDENHFVFLCKEGPMETLNGGKTWSLVAKMPEDYAKTHLGISLGYDAAHDVFYMIAGGHGGLRPVKYARQGVAPARAENPKTAELVPVQPAVARTGLIVDLDADKGVELTDGQVIAWKNQVDWKAKEFKATRTTGRPTLTKSVEAIRGHNSMVFDKKELINEEEDAFDHLITGSGYTWFAVLAVHQQVTMEKDVNAFFGNLRNGQHYEGFWGGVTDDNVVWAGSRNSTTFGRWNNDNPQLLGPKLEKNRFYVIAGRMGAGKGQVTIDLYVNQSRPVASKPFPVNPKANSSKMAIGQERDATNHPGRESFKGEISRILFWERPLTDPELAGTLDKLKEEYGIKSALAAEPAWQVYEAWPFDPAEAARRQSETSKAMAAADALKLPLGGAQGPTLNFRLIPAGKFTMGSPDTEPGHEPDEPLHPETVAEPFYMMETQLTVEAYRALLRSDPAGTPADADPKLPVAVSYRDAVDKVLPAISRVVPQGWKVILPDRVRLEYAARAGVATMNHGGNKEKDADPYVWYKANSDNKVHPVGQKKPNAWGLHDVLGNRWHWYWAGQGADGDASKENHLIYGGAYNTPAAGNGARLANIMVSRTPEGVRYALIRQDTPVPKGHPDPSAAKPGK